MKKPVIALDIDDTLFDHFADLAVWYNETFGTQLELANNHPRGAEALAAWKADSVEQAVRRVHAFYETPRFLHVQPYEAAKRAVPRLAERFEIVVVTARDISILEQSTHTWLERHFGGYYSDVHFTGQYSLDGRARTKREVLEAIGAQYLIDDSLENCMDAAAAGVQSLLYGSYPWNSHSSELPKRVVRLTDWPSVEAYFDGVI